MFSSIRTSLVPLVLLIDFVAGHSGEQHEAISRRELSSRQLAATKRHIHARRCAGAIDSFYSQRKSQQPFRSSMLTEDLGSGNPPAVSDTLLNSTCVTAPKVTEGPYYINNELIRTDLRESEDGISLTLDIGVIDVSTCQPLENAFVELWSCNATGIYGGYEEASLGTPGKDPRGPPHHPPGPKPPSDGPGGHRRGSTPLSSNSTFLRGGYATDGNGIAKIDTIYPGFYTGRTIHIHTMIHTNWKMSDNGTLISHAGSVVHIGQLFFEEGWNDKVLNTTVYLNPKTKRTYNWEDETLDEENADGNNAFVEIQMLGNDVSEGLLGFITIGVNTAADYAITNTNYYNSTSLTKEYQEKI